MNTVSDEELVRKAQAGSDAHFNILVDRHTPTVYRLALGITGKRQEAEDIVQETFVKIYVNLQRYSPSKAKFKTWLLTVARNQSINVFRSLKRRTSRLLVDYDVDRLSPDIGDNPVAQSYRNPEQMLSLRQETARTQSAVKQLPERQRTALLLKAQEGMTYEEIASIMKTSVSSVESLIFRARRKLLEILE
ncbi:MAG: RNA polymerase sigma factor [Desulfomonilaceae bacterium]|nr:RNA polymerase sigma factor [Desulfomonilaceae bacterium]